MPTPKVGMPRHGSRASYMIVQRFNRRFIFHVIAGTFTLVSNYAIADWPQFGGPNRDFTVDNIALALTWSEGGPRVLWRRKLGDGYSGISIADNHLITMFRDNDDEIVISLNPDDGATQWQHRYAAPVDTTKFAARYGYGPRSTPLIVDNRVYTVGYNGTLRCLDIETGRLQWKCELLNEFNGNRTRWGYACSPIRWKDSIIVFTGGDGASVVALDRRTGRVKWKRHDFKNSYGSPILINVGGQTQLICFMMKHVAGLNPDNGELYWSHPHENQWDNNIVTPVYGDDGVLFVTSEGSGGARALQLKRVGGTTRVSEIWHTRKLKVSHRNAIRIGDHIYASNGDFGPKSFDCINVKTGELAWRRRDLPKCGLLKVGKQLLMLAEDGRLMLATATPEVMTIHVEAQILNDPAWTIPTFDAGVSTMADYRIHVRDLKEIAAIELPAAAAGR